MDNNLKKGVYNKIANALSQNPNISDLKKEDASNSYVIECLVCGGIQFSFTMHKEAPLFVLKGTTPVIEFSDNVNAAEQDDKHASLMEIGAEVVEGTDIRHISYEDKLVFQYSIPTISDEFEGVNGQKKVFNETLNFVHIMCMHKDRLGCNASVSSMASLDFTTEAEDDPYGFNEFSDVDGEVLQPDKPVFDAVDADADDSLFHVPFTSSDDFGGKEEHLSEPASQEDVFTVSDTKDAEDLFLSESADNDLSADSHENMEIETEPEPEPVTESVEDAAPDFECMAKKIEEERIKRMKERKEERRKKRMASQRARAGQDMQDTLDVQDTQNDSSDIVQAYLQDEVHAAFTPGSVFENSAADLHKAADEFKNKDISGVNGMEENMSKDVRSIGGTNSNEAVSYERAPEVVEQMRHLYAEVEQLFAKRKEQADYREKGLNKFSESLDRRENELETRIIRMEENYNQKQAELEKTRLELETQRNEINFQWSKLQEEREMIESQRKDVEELRRLFEKEKESAPIKNNSDGEIRYLNQQIAEKKSEIASLKDALSELRKEHEEYLQSGAGEMQKNHTENTLRIRISELEDDVADLNQDVKDLIKENEQKSMIICNMQEKMRASAPNAGLLAQKEAAWTKKDADYKAQIMSLEQKLAETKKHEDSAGILQDKLDDAQLKIKQLEAEAAKRAESGAGSDASATIKRLNAELVQAKSDLKMAEQEYENIKKSKEDMDVSSNLPAKDVNAEAVSIKDSLSDIGVQVEPIVSNGGLVLSGFSDTMQIVVNVEAGVLYIEKPVKRGVKFRAQFESWNTENIRTSYMFSNNKIICKCVFDDVAKAVMDIVGRFSSLN